MRKHCRTILFILVPVFFALTLLCSVAKGEQRNGRRWAAILIGPIPTPEERAKEEAFRRPIYLLVQKAERLLERNDLWGAQQASEEALQKAGSRKGELADELAPVYLRSGQYNRAVALFGPCPDLGRNLSLNEAIALTKTHRLSDARKCWRESQIMSYHKDFMPYLPGLSSTKTFEATLFLCRGITDVDQNHPMNALWALRHALPLVPRNPLALWYYAEALAATGHAQEARRFYQEAIELDHGVVARRARKGMASLDHVGGPRL